MDRIMTILSAPICSLAGTLICLYVVFKIMQSWMIHNSKRPNYHLPPGPPRWPIFGNLLQLGSLPHRDFTSFCDKYGPLVYLKLGNVGAITTNDPEIIREILVQQEDVFASRPKTVAAVHLAYGCRDVSFAPLGPDWKRMRRICSEHLLTTKRFASFAKQRADEAQHLVREVWGKAQNGELINLRDALSGFSMNTTSRMLFGKQYFGAGSQEALEFMSVTRELFTLLGMFYLGDYIPIWRWIDPFGCEKQMRDVEKRIDDFHTKVIEEHRRNSNNGTKNGEEMDFVDVLLSLPGEDGQEHMDDAEIKALIHDMLLAATDTASVINEWAMAEVIKHPRVLGEIQQELDTFVGPDRMVSEADWPHLNYLRCVVQETFRLHPQGPIPHESVRATKLNDYDIPAKTRVFINTHGLGRNKNVWTDIDEFKPERHMLADGARVEISHGGNFKTMPFSAGKRKCPGGALGVTMVLMALARMFHSFNWAPPEGMKHGDIDTREVHRLITPMAIPLMARATPRLNDHLYR